jgi:muramoyltetrapeptide carboxypeptidase
MIRPPRLRPGDRVAVVAPSGPVPRERFEAGARILAGRYQLVHDERVFHRSGFLAGEDPARLAELSAALGDPSIKAVFCARGGYGLMRLLRELDSARFLHAPKPIVGFSDLTALHAWTSRLGVTSIHGPVLTQLGDLPPEDAASLIALLETSEPPPAVTGLAVLREGSARGILRGGNLEVLSRLIGTPWQVSLDGAIWLIEEVAERPYRIDRILTHLELAGALVGLSGVVVGTLERCHETGPHPSPTAEEVLVERLGRLGVPILAGAPVGHGARNHPLPLGVHVELGAGSLRFLEAPFF